MEDFNFDDGTFIQRGLESLRASPKDVFCKIGDVSVYYFPRPVKHKIIGYDLLFWDGLLKPESDMLATYFKYTSPVTGRSRFSFNATPYAFKNKKLFLDLIRKHFISTEGKRLRNRDDAESLLVSRGSNTFKVEVVDGDLLYVASNIEFKEEYLLDDTLSHTFTGSELRYTLEVRDVITNDSEVTNVVREGLALFENQIKLVQLIKDDITPP